MSVTAGRHLRVEGRELTPGELAGSLDGAVLTRVSLAFARAPGLRAEQASIRFADARAAELGGADLTGTLLQHVDLTHADLRGASLRGATLRDCDLEGARLDGADLTNASLLRCAGDGASLQRARLTDAVTVACSFVDASVEGARDFATCRDLVVELLRREARDPGELAVIAEVAFDRRLCYDEWRERLTPQQHARAVAAFARYPESGFAAALAGGG
jgi:hypothetical protein